MERPSSSLRLHFLGSRAALTASPRALRRTEKGLNARIERPIARSFFSEPRCFSVSPRATTDRGVNCGAVVVVRSCLLRHTRADGRSCVCTVVHCVKKEDRKFVILGASGAPQFASRLATPRF